MRPHDVELRFGALELSHEGHSAKPQKKRVPMDKGNDFQRKKRIFERIPKQPRTRKGPPLATDGAEQRFFTLREDVDVNLPT